MHLDGLFDALRFCFFALFVGVHLALFAGLAMERRKARSRIARTRECAGLGSREEAPRPSACVVIPAHNEEEVLGPLLEALGAQDYPGLRFRFIDDRSTDHTAALMEAFAAGMGEGRSSILRITENQGPNKKQRALEEGLRGVDTDIILFTDADCVPPPSWARGMIDALQTRPDSGVVFGPVFKRIEDRRFLSEYQAFDHAVRYAYIASAAGLGQSTGAFGNNMAVKREALEAIGGYGAVPVSLTEDAALVSLIHQKTKFGVHPALGRDVSMVTEPVETWKELVGQGLRWNDGGLFAPDLPTRISFGALSLSITAGCLALPALILLPGLWPLPLAVLIAMSGNSIAASMLAADGVPLRPRILVLGVIVMPLVYSYLTIAALAGKKVVWKDVILNAG